MSRSDELLRHVDKRGRGVEIGPSHNPIAPKKAGYAVDIIDHLTRDQLIEKYADHKVELKNIEDVDFVWAGEPYSQLTGKSNYYDWIIASHVIEHTPDFVGFLNNCDAILKPDGVLSLAVPDHRYCFDTFRPATGLAKIIDAHLRGDTRHTPGTLAEYFLNVANKGGIISWGPCYPGEHKFIHGLNDARAFLGAAPGGAYVDVHAWCFTPHSFRLLIYDLNCLGLMPFKEVAFSAPGGGEFFVTLGRRGEGPGVGRLEMLYRIRDEEAEESRHAEGRPDTGGAGAEARLAAVLRSYSWRLTAPLRKVSSWVRGV